MRSRWQFTIADQDIDFLGDGETLVVNYIVNVRDDSGNGATDSTSQVVTVTITGTNDVPLIDVRAGVTDLEGTINEIADLSTSPPELVTNLVETGVVTFTDVDLSDQHTASITASSVTGATLANGYTLTSGQTDVLLDAFFLNAGDGGPRTSFDSTFGSAASGEGTVNWTYDISDQNIDFLGENDELELSFEVTINDGNGGTVTDTVVITVTGTNDAAIIAAQPVAPEGSVTEDVATPTLESTGSIGFTDVDLTDTHIVSVEFTSSDHPAGSTVQLGSISTIVVSPDTTTTGLNGEIDWTYQVANADVQFLGEGEVITETYTITLDDEKTGGQVTREIEVTITGVNDAAIIAAQPVAPEGSVTEDVATPTLESTGSIGFTDVDLTDTHIVSVEFTSSDHPAGSTVQLGSISTIVVSPDTTTTGLNGEIDWTYQVANADVQFLGEGEVITETYTITLDDEKTGGQVTREIEVTITGVNDAAIIAAQPVAPEGSVTEDVATPTLESTGSIGFTDVDLTDTHIVSVEFTSSDHPAGSTVQLGSISTIVVSPDTTTTGLNGEIDWTYQVANADVQFLGEGEVITEPPTPSHWTTRQTGGQVTREIEVTITGVNDAAIIAAQPVAPEGSVTEDVATPTLESTGSIGFTDVDLTDTHIVSVEFTSSDHPAGSTVQLGSISTIVVSPDTTTTGLNGEIDWTYQVANADVQFLGEGEVITETYTITLDDEKTGGQVTREIEVTITGVNDAAIIAAQPVAPEGSVTEDVATPTLESTGSIGFTDVDLTDTHIVSVEFTSSDHPAGSTVQLGSISTIVVSPDTTTTGLNGEIDWTYQVANADVQFLGEGEVITETYTITLKDQNNVPVTRDIEVTITGVNDAAVIAALPTAPVGVTEDTAPTLTDTGTIVFEDIDLIDTHTATAAFKSSDVAGGGQLGGITAIGVTTDTDGTGPGENGVISWTYEVADAAVQFLGEGEVITETYTITLKDQNNVPVTRDIEVTITGADNDNGPPLSTLTILSNESEFWNYNDVPSETYLTQPGEPDVFILNNIPEMDAFAVTGFVPTEDVLDLSALLNDPYFTDAGVSDYLAVVDNGTDTTIKVDSDGTDNGSNYVDLVTLTGVSGAEIFITTAPPFTE